VKPVPKTEKIEPVAKVAKPVTKPVVKPVAKPKQKAPIVTTKVEKPIRKSKPIAEKEPSKLMKKQEQESKRMNRRPFQLSHLCQNRLQQLLPGHRRLVQQRELPRRSIS